MAIDDWKLELLLFTPQPRANGFGFLAGSVGGIVAATGVFRNRCQYGRTAGAAVRGRRRADAYAPRQGKDVAPQAHNATVMALVITIIGLLLVVKGLRGL